MRAFIFRSLFLSLFSLSVHAQGFYLGAEYSRLGVGSLDFDAVFLSGGVGLNDWLSLEGRVGKSKKKEEDNEEVEIESILGAYVKLSARNKKSFISPYVLLGYARTDVDLIDEDGDDLGGSTSDFSYGLGMDFDVSERFYIDVDYINYLDKNGFDITAYSLGLNYQF